MAEIKSIEQAKAAAQHTVESQRTQMLLRKAEFDRYMEAIKKAQPEEGGFDELATLLTLPEEYFSLLAPVYLDELERGMRQSKEQLILIQYMGIHGLKLEDLQKQYEEIYIELDRQIGEVLSSQKRDFLKQLLGITYNAVAEAEGVAKKNILIPIEYCHPDAKIPTYAHLTDSGMDVFALDDITIAPGETKLVPTGIKVAIPAGYELQVRPKSGRCLKTKLRVANTPGTIDAGYRDEIGVIIDNIEPFIKSAEMDENGRLYNVEFGSSHTIGKGEKFAQLVLCEVPKAVFYQVENISEVANDGRNGGFGSTGVK